MGALGLRETTEGMEDALQGSSTASCGYARTTHFTMYYSLRPAKRTSAKLTHSVLFSTSASTMVVRGASLSNGRLNCSIF